MRETPFISGSLSHYADNGRSGRYESLDPTEGGIDGPVWNSVLHSSNISIGSLVESVSKKAFYARNQQAIVYCRGWFHRDEVFGPQANPEQWPFLVPTLLVSILGEKPASRRELVAFREVLKPDNRSSLEVTEDFSVPVWVSEYSKFEKLCGVWNGNPMWRVIE